MNDEWFRVCLKSKRNVCLRQHLNRRRQVLFAAACCRVIWNLLDESSRRAVEAVEGFIDGSVNKRNFEDLVYAVTSRNLPVGVAGSNAVASTAHAARAFVIWSLGPQDFAAAAAANASYAGAGLVGATEFPTWWRARQMEWHKQNLIFNSFLPVDVNPDWKTQMTCDLARATYEDAKTFPVLLDALEDVGIDVSSHRNVTFFKGNWLVDWLGGKESIALR